MMWWGYPPGVGWGWMIVGILWMVIFWGAIIGVVVWGIRALAGPRHYGGPPESPESIAERRYATGEITRQQLDEIREGLRKGGRGAAAV